MASAARHDTTHRPTHTKPAMPNGNVTYGHLSAFRGKQTRSQPGGGYVGSPALQLAPGVSMARGSSAQKTPGGLGPGHGPSKGDPAYGAAKAGPAARLGK